MAITWITPAGDLGIITERIILSIPLEAESDQGLVTYTLIAGNLPRGLRIVNADHTDSTQTTGYITGSPVEVKRFTENRFVIRASDGQDIEDRTFKLSVDGSDVPRWLTAEGFLQVGEGDNYFVLDNAYVNFQLEATDTDLTAGDTLTFYLSPMGGELPPGLSLSKDGVISGFTDPIFAVDYVSNLTGAFDTAGYDITPLDVAEARSNGYDSYFYDNVTFDYNEPSQSPRRLSRFYTFVVGITDGVNDVRRIFRIWVVTEEFLQADNSIIQVDTNLFRADNSSDRKPLWITESYLGQYRANNYVTVYLDVYDPPSLDGVITYFLISTNPDGSASTLPPGLTLDTITGEIAGRVPYQAAITTTYQFTMQAVSFPAALAEIEYTLVGDWSATRTYLPNEAVRFRGFIYVCLRTNRNQVPQEGEYWNLAVSTADKTFTIDIIGEIESAITWITDSDRGVIKPNQPSDIYVEAESNYYGGKVIYELVAGTLPPGLNLIATGLILGKVNQFGDDSAPGIIRFYDRVDSIDPETEDSSTGSKQFNTTFDNSATTFDRVFAFSIRARDSANFAENIREFTISVDTENTKSFANLFLKAFQSKPKRLAWYNFITDSGIFRSDEIYRYGDPNFGIQGELRMLLFAGIESVNAVKYVQAMSRNHYRKQIRFGDVKYAVAKDQTTQEIIYEIVYVEVVDEFEKNGKSISKTVELPNTINSRVLVSYDAIRIDSDIPLVSDRDHQRVFPNSIKNMRSRIKAVGDRERTFLPLWMRSIQDRSFVESGFAKAIPLCFLKPGNSEAVISRIKSNGFDFKSIDFTADRYVIDILDGQIEDKYLAFPQRGEKLP